MSGARLPAVETARCTSKTCRWELRRWIAGRGGKFATCEGCGDRFPCARPCKHEDCNETRAALAKPEAA